jgi:hypothetical protein
MKPLPKIPWDKAPPWANYAAYQPTGVLRWFEWEPILQHGQWCLSLFGGRYQDHEPVRREGWEGSLERRPEKIEKRVAGKRRTE